MSSSGGGEREFLECESHVLRPKELLLFFFFFNKHLFLFVLFLFILLPCHMACGILVPQEGIKPAAPALKVWSLNHWTAREVPRDPKI